MNVLSLFDGISCGQVALKRAGVHVDNYFASEIDANGIKISTHNFPNTVHLGDVTKIDVSALPKIKLLIGGSPCQGFSFSGKRLGACTADIVEITTLDQYLTAKRAGVKFNGQSYLFWEYVRILRDLNKGRGVYFLLENVRMIPKWEAVISDVLGVEPLRINSNVVCAQDRLRLYWTNIPQRSEIHPRKVTLGDIIDRTFPPEYDITERFYKKHYGTLAWEKSRKNCRRLDERSRCLTTLGQSIANTGATNIFISKDHIRKPSPLESERLQTLPDNYTKVSGVSETGRYFGIGNGWTVDIVAHIFKGLRPAPPKNAGSPPGAWGANFCVPASGK